MPTPGDSELPGFDDPLGLLRACHTKILEHCELLERLAAAPHGDDGADGLRERARRVISCFANSARLHHLDEEHDLFPLLARQSLKLADLIHALKREHHALDELWTGLETVLKQFPQPADPDRFSADAARFCALNREHVRRENLEFLPLAASSLSSVQLRDLGAAMAARRGVNDPS